MAQEQKTPTGTASVSTPAPVTLTHEQALAEVKRLSDFASDCEQKLASLPFNPFTHLTVEQTAALVTRLNPQWKETQAGAVKDTAAEFKVSDSEATILVWLRTTADDAIESRLLSGKLASCKSLLENVAAGSLATLAIIAEDYKSLPPTCLRAYRIGVRDSIYKRWIGETAKRIMEAVMVSTGVQPETAWTR